MACNPLADHCMLVVAPNGKDIWHMCLDVDKICVEVQTVGQIHNCGDCNNG